MTIGSLLDEIKMFRLLWIALVCLLVACTAIKSNTHSRTSSISEQHSTIDNRQNLHTKSYSDQTGDLSSVPNDLYNGPLPDGAEDWEYDQDPLPPEALVKFQSLSRGPDVSRNYRWILYPDGRLFLARHSGNVAETSIVFDTELPSIPTKILDVATVKQVEKKLRNSNFFNQAPYQFNQGVQDGSWYVVTARLDNKIHQVIYDAYAPPLVDFLETIE
jgi:hypothetical protein